MEENVDTCSHDQSAEHKSRVAVLHPEDPRCDVILEVSAQGGAMDLYVSSKALSLASSVFDKMFSSNYKEGVQHRQDPGRTRVRLPEDDGDALMAICKVTHHRPGDLTRTFTAQELLQIAYVSEKYDFTETVRHWSSLWLGAILRQGTEEDLGLLLCAAYMLDAYEEFSRISFDLLCRQAGLSSQYAALEGLELPNSTKGKQIALNTTIG